MHPRQVFHPHHIGWLTRGCAASCFCHPEVAALARGPIPCRERTDGSNPLSSSSEFVANHRRWLGNAARFGQRAARPERRIYLDGWVTATISDFATLAPTQKVAGPAIVDSAMTTVLLPPRDEATVSPPLWLNIEFEASKP
jgi:hypothetical protein